jgi:hypothetical protein
VKARSRDEFEPDMMPELHQSRIPVIKRNMDDF